MEKKNRTKGNRLLQLFALSSQMTASIIGFAILGYFLDDYYHVHEMYFTLGCTLVGIFMGLYLLMRGIKNLNN